jgi:hypothetical protein
VTADEALEAAAAAVVAAKLNLCNWPVSRTPLFPLPRASLLSRGDRDAGAGMAAVVAFSVWAARIAWGASEKPRRGSCFESTRLVSVPSVERFLGISTPKLCLRRTSLEVSSLLEQCVG